MRLLTRRRSLVDLAAEAIATDPLDGPLVQLEASIMADDMARYAPAAVEPVREAAQR